MVDIEDGDRVDVLIQNHKAVITGNHTTPAITRMGDVYVQPTDEGLVVGQLDDSGEPTGAYLLVSPTQTVVYNSDKNAIARFGATSQIGLDNAVHTQTTASGYRVLDANGKPVSNVYMEFTVNNKIYNRTTYENGSFKPYKLNMIRAGRYTMAFNFAGDDNYTNAFACVCVDLDKKPITIKASKKTYKIATKTKKYTVTLSTIKGLDGKMHLSPKKVTLKVNGKTYTGKTNSKGQVTFKINNLKKKAKYKATISYKGDKTYEAATKSVTLTVK